MRNNYLPKYGDQTGGGGVEGVGVRGGGGGVKVVLIDQVINIPSHANWHAILFHTGNISLSSISCFPSRRGISLCVASHALTLSLTSLPLLWLLEGYPSLHFHCSGY
jgi:hypothetical protein